MRILLALALAFAMPSDPQHEALAALAGNWSVEQTLWLAPGQPQHDHGTASFDVVLGHHLRQVLRIPGKDKPFEGLGYLGYDNASGRFFSTWMDVNFPGLILAQGSRDASGTYTFEGSMSDASKPGATIPVHEVLRIADADHFTYEYYERRGGSETLTVRLEYTRTR